MVEILVQTCAKDGDDPGFWRQRLAEEMAVAERTIANLIAAGQIGYPITVSLEDAGTDDGPLGRWHNTRVEIRGHRTV